MNLRWGRIAVAAICGELFPVILLVAAVALFGPSDLPSAEAFAQRLGRWVGPLGGALACFLGAAWAVRPLEGAGRLHGLAVGVSVACVDAIILLILQPPFEWLFVISDLGKILAGYMGGAIMSMNSVGEPDQGIQ
jgi:hypothetical protein